MKTILPIVLLLTIKSSVSYGTPLFEDAGNKAPPPPPQSLHKNLPPITNLENDKESLLKPEERTRMLLDSKMFQSFDGKYMYQGDILLTEEQAMKVIQRKMYWNTDYYWKRNSDGKLIINYVIKEGDNVSKGDISEAIKIWQTETCAKFKLLPSPPADKSAHLRFENKGFCWSYYGTTNNDLDGGHTVSLPENCGVEGGVHEIGHAMGFYHEHNRSDRDKYVKILVNNIIPKWLYAFNKQEQSLNNDVPYDYSSAMHYEGYAFSNDSELTIRTLDSKFQYIIGMQEKMSFRDAKIFNKAYKCIDDWEMACAALIGKCKNEGYVKKDNTGKCACKCPFNTKGEFCEKLNYSYNDGIIKQYGRKYQKANN